MEFTKEELRKEFSRLISYATEQDSLDEYHKILDTALELSLFFKNYKFKSQADGDSTILFQMVIGKALSILKLLNGTSYTSNSNEKIHFENFIDPFSIWPLVRTQFEAFCNFNNIYVSHSNDKAELLYDLWVFSGLMYRQSFTELASTKENIEKAENEKKHIEKIKQEIHNSTLYQSLNQKERDKIDTEITRKNFQIYFQGNVIMQGHWHQLLKNAGVGSLFNKFYNYLSLNTHPSNVSVFQFDEMFIRGQERENAYFGMRVSGLLMSFLIRDFCMYFPELKTIFEKQPIINQILINFLNKTFRGTNYTINESINLLN